MMIKNRGLLLWGIFVLIIFSNYILAQSEMIGNNGLENDAGKILNATEKLKGLTEENRWEYLAQEWRELLLKNSFIASADGFFKKINFIFVFLFGQDYILSLTLFFAVLLWIFLFLSFGYILKNFSTFNSLISYIIAFAVSVISAQVGILNQISSVIFKIIFFKEGIWRWIFFFLVLIVIAVLFTFIRIITNKIKKSKKKKLEMRQELEQKVLHKTVEGINEANKNV